MEQIITIRLLLGAADGGHIDIVRLMLESGANYNNDEAMSLAAEYGFIDIEIFNLIKQWKSTN